MTYKATLERGNVYYYQGVAYKHGEPQMVTDEQKEYLEKEAVDVKNDGADVFEKPKFKFTKVADAEAEISEEDSGKESVTKPATRARAAK